MIKGCTHYSGGQIKYFIGKLLPVGVKTIVFDLVLINLQINAITGTVEIEHLWDARVCRFHIYRQGILIIL
jgi:hypothetical protein